MDIALCGDQCQHKCLANHEPHLPHTWFYTSGGGGHELVSVSPDDTERNVKQHQCPGIEGTLNTDGMDPFTAELERQAFDAEWTRIRRLSQPAFNPPSKVALIGRCDSHKSGADQKYSHARSPQCINWAQDMHQPPPGTYNAQISSKPGEPLEFTVDLPDNHTTDQMIEAMHEAARKAGLLP